MPSATQPPQPLPAYYIGHAGVGLLYRETDNNRIVQDNLRAIGDEILALSPRPKAIVTFSGHFEAGEIHGPGVIEGELSTSGEASAWLAEGIRIADTVPHSKRQRGDIYSGERTPIILQRHHVT
jgi:hypothetical protein